METPHQAVAAVFEECARLLRQHPERFGESAIEYVAIVAGLSVRVTRASAREPADLASVIHSVVPTFFPALVKAAGRDRGALVVLAGARRGFVRATDRITALRLSRSPYVVTAERELMLTSPCPRCETVATRPMESPPPCACGFVFA